MMLQTNCSNYIRFRFPDKTTSIRDIWTTGTSDGVQLSETLKFKFVDISADENLNIYNNENILNTSSVASALLRKAWFDTTRYIE